MASSSSSSSGGSNVTPSSLTADSFAISTPPSSSTSPQLTSPPPDKVPFSFPNQDHKKTLLVRSLGPDVCQKYIRELFLPYGSIKSLRLLWERDVDTIASIEFEDRRSAEKAMSEIEKITKQDRVDRFGNADAMTATKVSGEAEDEDKDIRGDAGQESSDPENATSMSMIDQNKGNARAKTVVVNKEDTKGFTVFIGNTQNLTEEDLIEAFQPYGRILRVFLMRSKNFAYLTFDDEFSVGVAISRMDGATVKNTTIRVDKDWNPERMTKKKTRIEKDEKREEGKNCCVFVGATGNLTEEDLTEAFKPFGRIRKLVLVRDYKTGLSKKFAFVTYANETSARDAIREMNGATVKNATIGVLWDHGGKTDAKKKKRVEKEDELVLERQTEPEEMSEQAGPEVRALVTTAGKEEGREMELGRKRELYYDKISQESSPDNTTIFCCYKKGILTDQILRKKFSPFGKITGVKCYEDEGYGFIRFEERSSAIEAIIEKNGVKPKSGGVVMVGWGNW